MNGVDITLEQNAFLVNDKIKEFSDGFIHFLTNPNITHENIEDEEDKKITDLFGLLDKIQEHVIREAIDLKQKNTCLIGEEIFI